GRAIVEAINAISSRNDVVAQGFLNTPKAIGEIPDNINKSVERVKKGEGEEVATDLIGQAWADALMGFAVNRAQSSLRSHGSKGDSSGGNTKGGDSSSSSHGGPSGGSGGGGAAGGGTSTAGAHGGGTSQGSPTSSAAGARSPGGGQSQGSPGTTNTPGGTPGTGSDTSGAFSKPATPKGIPFGPPGRDIQLAIKDGGVAILGDDFGKLAPQFGRLPKKEGWFDVGIHADKQGFWTVEKGQWKQVPIEGVVEAMKQAGYAGEKVRLVSCNSVAVARQLAKALNQTVEGRSATVVVTSQLGTTPHISGKGMGIQRLIAQFQGRTAPPIDAGVLVEPPKTLGNVLKNATSGLGR
ncbi:MAG: hypothetical protein ACOY3P_16535, partial [Planctomycetota bacterium]